MCPKFLGLPDMVRGTLDNLPPIIETDVDLRKKPKYASALQTGRMLNKSVFQILKAYEKAVKKYHYFRDLMVRGLSFKKAINIIEKNIENFEPKQKEHNGVKIGIILTTLATALIHFSLLFPDVLFILNGLGYLALLAAYFLPINLAQRYHNLVRWGFLAFTLVTILAWIAIGDKSWPAGSLGYLTKLIEIILIILLLVDKQPDQAIQPKSQ